MVIHLSFNLNLVLHGHPPHNYVSKQIRIALRVLSERRRVQLAATLTLASTPATAKDTVLVYGPSVCTSTSTGTCTTLHAGMLGPNHLSFHLSSSLFGAIHFGIAVIITETPPSQHMPLNSKGLNAIVFFWCETLEGAYDRCILLVWCV